MPSPHFDAILFDLDGTLVDTLDDFLVALNAMLRELFSLPFFQSLTGPVPALTRPDVTPMVGKGSEHLVRQALLWVQAQGAGGLAFPRLNGRGAINAAGSESLGDSKDAEHFKNENVQNFTDFTGVENFSANKDSQNFESFEDFEKLALARYLSHYAQVNGRAATLYPGVAAALRRWQSAGMPMVCLTNKPEGFARALLAHLNCLTYFQAVIGGDTYAHKKPHPLPLLKACELLKTPAERTLMVGDSVNDVLAARAAHCPVILVSYGYNHGHPASTAGADRVIDSLAELG